MKKKWKTSGTTREINDERVESRVDWMECRETDDKWKILNIFIIYALYHTK